LFVLFKNQNIDFYHQMTKIRTRADISRLWLSTSTIKIFHILLLDKSYDFSYFLLLCINNIIIVTFISLHLIKLIVLFFWRSLYLLVYDWFTNDERSLSVAYRFGLDIYQFIGFDKTRKGLIGFVPIPCCSRVTTVLLYFLTSDSKW
jgi:hypothetical protein